MKGIVAVFFASTLLAAAASCGGHAGHDTHTPAAPALGAPAKGGLDVVGTALFVALGKTGEVAVIDVDAWKVAGKVKLAASFFPHHLGLSPDRKRIAVGAPAADLSGGHAGHGMGGGSGALFLMDSRTGDVLAQRQVSGTAHNLAFMPDGAKAVYALSEHGMLHIADAVTLNELGGVDVGGSPLEASPLPSGQTVLVSNSSAGTISVVDVAVRKVAKRLQVGSNRIAAWMASSSVALVTSEADKKLSAIDLPTMEVTKTVELAGIPGQATLTGDGKQVWVAYEDKGVIAVLSFPELLPVGEIVIGSRPHGLVPAVDGKSIFVTDQSTGRVHQVDVATRAVTRMLDVGGAPNGILVRPSL